MLSSETRWSHSPAEPLVLLSRESRCSAAGGVAWRAPSTASRGWAAGALGESLRRSAVARATGRGSAGGDAAAALGCGRASPRPEAASGRGGATRPGSTRGLGALRWITGAGDELGRTRRTGLAPGARAPVGGGGDAVGLAASATSAPLGSGAASGSASPAGAAARRAPRAARAACSSSARSTAWCRGCGCKGRGVSD